MKKNIIYSKLMVAFLICAVILPACSDLLTKAPTDTLVKEKFWTKKEDVYAVLGATYDAFRDESLKSFVWGELRGDMVTFSTRLSNYTQIANNSIRPSNGAISWSGYYNAINLANTLIYYSSEVLDKDESFTMDIKEGIEAEAIFIRSLSYFYLVRMWRDVPLVMEPTVSDTLDLFIPKSPERVVIDQVIADLIYAKDIANTDKFVDNPVYYKGRANKYAIMALLADIYLWNEQYQKCVDYCDSIINTGKFSLESTNEWFKLYYPGNSMKESIFEIQYDSNYENQDNPIHGSDYADTKSKTSKLKLNSEITSTIVSKEDIRFVGKGPIWKYIGISNNSATSRSDSEWDANFIYYRYADVLLNKAEALCELGQITDANQLARQVADRAITTWSYKETKEDLALAILNEKCKEFAVEGKRWFDLLRYAKRDNFDKKFIIADIILSKAKDVLEVAILKTKAYDVNFYYLPIPQSEIESNPQLIQNPFYDR